jgi:hypothetical protein
MEIVKAIQAKKEGLMRIGGMVLILFGLILSIIFDSFLLNNVMLFSFVLLIVISWFVLIILLKLEKDFFVNNAVKLSIILLALSVIFIIMDFFISSTDSNALYFAFLSISNILIVLSWHFALSIYKKQKIFFILGSVIFCIFTLIFRIGPLVILFGLFLGLTPLLLVAFGICLIIIAEFRMKKKGFLNYI